MKKLALTFLLLLLSAVHLKAISIEFNAINEYVFNTKEALNLIVISDNPKTFPVIIVGKITDGNGQTVVEFKSSEVQINPGSNLISTINTSLTEINYFNTDIGEIENRTGTYPSGNYTICIWLNCLTQDCSGAGKDAALMEQAKCTNVHVENPTPLILTFPENDGEIEETRPLFTWIPPSPVAGSANLNYTMILVEIMQGQSKADALSMNRPLLEMDGIMNPSMLFPPDLAELEPGKSYAWQVQAYVGKTPIAKSEQWKFKIKKKVEKIEKPTFVRLKTDDKSIYHVRQDIYFTYIEEYVPETLKLTIMGVNGDVIYQNNEEYKTKRGENSFTIALMGLPLSKDQVYELIVKNAKGEIYTLRFKLI